MKYLSFVLFTIIMLSACSDPNAKIISTSETIIKGIIDNPDSYDYQELELMEKTTYGANIKFWENYFRQSYIQTPNQAFEADIKALKDKYKDKMNAASAFKYRIHYTEVAGQNKAKKTRVLYFDENQEQVVGWVYIYGLDAFEFDGLETLEKYGEII